MKPVNKKLTRVMTETMDIYEDLKRDQDYRHYWGWNPKAAWTIAYGSARNLIKQFEQDGPYGRIV